MKTILLLVASLLVAATWAVAQEEPDLDDPKVRQKLLKEAVSLRTFVERRSDGEIICYNHERPHRSQGLLTPKNFSRTLTRQGPDSSRPAGSLCRGLSHTENNNEPAEIISSQVDQIAGSKQ